MLESLENDEIDELRQRLSQRGCVFEFTLCLADEQEVVDYEVHRHALTVLFDQINRRLQKERADLTAQEPGFATLPWFELEVQVEKAYPRRLSAIESRALTEPRGVLEGAFLNPPHGTSLSEKDFREWLEVLQLLPDTELEVFDWVGDPNEEPQRSSWSNYFADGREWWGVWCLTAFNPVRRTLCVMIASSTD